MDYLDDLEKSGLTEATIEAMAIKKLHNTDINFIEDMGYSTQMAKKVLAQKCVYAIPYQEKNYARVKLIPPILIDNDGKTKTIKYLSPKKEICDKAPVYYLPKSFDYLHSLEHPLIITEGEKKCAKLTQEVGSLFDAAVVGVPGVTLWRKCLEFEDLEFENRLVYIFFDADFTQNKNVQAELVKLYLYLYAKGADVKVATWQGSKGIDDYLITLDNPASELHSLVEKSLSGQAFFEVCCLMKAEDISKAMFKVDYKREQAQNLFKKLALEDVYQVTKSRFREICKEVFESQTKQKNLNQMKSLAGQNNPTSVFEKKGCTYMATTRGKGESEEVIEVMIADFTMEILKDVREANSQNLRREILINTSKGKKHTLTLNNEQLSEATSFRNIVNSKIRVAYNVTRISDHNEFLTYYENKSTPTEWVENEEVGHVQSGIFIANNIVVTPSDCRTFDEMKIVPPQDDRLYISIEQCDIKEFISLLDKAIPLQTWKVLGFVVSSIFAEQFMQNGIKIPVLNMYGRSGSGKDTIANAIQSCCGVRTDAFLERNMGLKSTKKSFHRMASKYVGIPLKSNEYTSSPENNIEICALWDRSSYSHAKKSMDLSIIEKKTRSSFIVLGTQNITGAKSEDVQTRIVTVDMNEATSNVTVGNILSNNSYRTKLSYFVVFALRNLDANNISKKILQLEEECVEAANTEEISLHPRIIRNHVVLMACANSVYTALDYPENITWEDIKPDVIARQKTTETVDVGRIFLNHLISMIEGGNISSKLALIESDKLYFRSLSTVLPHVQRFAKQSSGDEFEIKSLKESLLRLGVRINTTSTKFDTGICKCCTFNIQDSQVSNSSIQEYASHYEQEVMLGDT